jgi:hypothetical protein
LEVFCAGPPSPRPAVGSKTFGSDASQRWPRLPKEGLGEPRRVQEQMVEDVCAENNQHLFDYHIPIADKPDF